MTPTAPVDAPLVDVAIIGGTGKLGMALAARFARAGHVVAIGSRVASKAVDAAATVTERLGYLSTTVYGAENAAAAAIEGVVVVAVPYDGLNDDLRELAPSIGERVVVSAVVPVRFVTGEGPTHVDVPEGSAGERLAAMLPAARVVGALQTLSFVTLRDIDRDVDSDIILTGDDAAAKTTVAALLTSLGGGRMIDGGPLRNSRYVEQLTVLLLSMNKHYRRHTGVRISDLPDELVRGSWT